MIRSALLVILGVAITGFLSLCAILFSYISPGENKIHKIANLWARILLLISATKVEVIGAENVLHRSPQIFMANHSSDFDILIVLAHIPGQFRWIAKKELFRIPLFGKAMRNAGYIEIDRQHHERALASIAEAAAKIREGKSVMTFPEGTRSKDGKIKAFKQGMFYLAIESGVPIVPISIIGASEIMPKRSLRVQAGTITMVIDKPIDVSGYTIETREDLIEKVRGVIVRNFDEYEALRRRSSG
jgi:1-acyl-sn-glycerol-3-phosphate acyltransferase